jgi:RHS repeat-associated protein
MAGTSGTGEAVYFDNLRVEQTGGLIVQEQHQYAFGAPLPGLSYVVGTKRYRYGYQGQYAEHDEETGFESFQLRLYNSRVGRWMSYDPEGQFDSPYVGMGNNPVSGVDPDGGLSLGPGPKAFVKGMARNKTGELFGVAAKSGLNRTMVGALGSALRGVSTTQRSYLAGDRISVGGRTITLNAPENRRGPTSGVRSNFNPFSTASRQLATSHIIEHADGGIFRMMIGYSPYPELDTQASFPAIGMLGELPAARAVTAATRPQLLLRAGITFPKIAKHFLKHAIGKGEWAQWGTITEAIYAERAMALANSPIGARGGKILGFTSDAGYLFKYNAATGEFLDVAPNGTIETFFRPERGMDYYLEQMTKYGTRK